MDGARSTTRPSTASDGDHYAVYRGGRPLVGFDTDRESFFGLYNGWGEPPVVAEGQSRNSVASGWAPIGSQSLAVDLAPGGRQTFVFVLGYVENPREEKWESPGVVNKTRARALLSRFGTSAQVDGALAELRDYWTDLLSKYTARTGDPRVDRMANIWNPYQCMVTFNMSRSASYFETGIGRGMGFRDSNQDLLGFVHLVPGASAGAHHRHRRDPVRRRQRVPPVPAAHQAREQRRRMRIQRRPGVADRGRGRLYQGDGGPTAS